MSDLLCYYNSGGILNKGQDLMKFYWFCEQSVWNDLKTIGTNLE